MFRPLLSTCIAFLLWSCSLAQGQAEHGNPPLSPAARLAAAKSAYMRNGGGSEVAFNVISDSLQGWGRYQIVGAPERADLIIEVASPSGTGGVSVSGTVSKGSGQGQPQETTTRSPYLQVARITLIVYDARSKMALWSASEQPKGGFRHKAREDKIVESAQHLVTQFREKVEPDAGK